MKEGRDMRLLLVVGVPLIVLSGCSKAEPTLSGGKPVSHWVEALRTSTDAKVRKEAAFKLGNVGPADPTACPALVGALKDRDAAVRSEVVLALVKFGSAAHEAVPVLTNLRDHDPDPKVRSYAARALEKIQIKE
jgi:HEAT repeat protein